MNVPILDVDVLCDVVYDILFNCIILSNQMGVFAMSWLAQVERRTELDEV